MIHFWAIPILLHVQQTIFWMIMNDLDIFKATPMLTQTNISEPELLHRNTDRSRTFREGMNKYQIWVRSESGLKVWKPESPNYIHMSIHVNSCQFRNFSQISQISRRFRPWAGASPEFPRDITRWWRDDWDRNSQVDPLLHGSGWDFWDIFPID